MTGEQTGRQVPVVPVDSTCYERFDTLAESRKWAAFPARQDRVLRVADQDWKGLFSVPMIPQEARERLRVEQGTTSGTFKDANQRRREDVLWDMDLAARSGMKYASIFMLMAELLMRAHQQVPDDDDQISRKEIGQLLLLFWASGEAYIRPVCKGGGQIRSYSEERTLCQRSVGLHWKRNPGCYTLPFKGPDLFAGQFQTRLQEEVARRETLTKSNFRLPEQGRGRARARGTRQPRGGRGGRGSYSRGLLQRSWLWSRKSERLAESQQCDPGSERLTATDPPQVPRSLPVPRGAHLTSDTPKVGGRLQRFAQNWAKYWGRPVGRNNSDPGLPHRIHLTPAFRGRREENDGPQGSDRKERL